MSQRVGRHTNEAGLPLLLVSKKKTLSEGQETWKGLSSGMDLIGKLLIKITSKGSREGLALGLQVHFSAPAVHFYHLVYIKREGKEIL